MTDETKPQDDKAMSPASAGSHGSHVAWALLANGRFIESYRAWEQAVAAANERERRMALIEGVPCENNGTPVEHQVVPLYRSPTLTDEEREAVEASVRYWAGPFRPHPHAAVLRKLLERLK